MEPLYPCGALSTVYVCVCVCLRSSETITPMMTSQCFYIYVIRIFLSFRFSYPHIVWTRSPLHAFHINVVSRCCCHCHCHVLLLDDYFFFTIKYKMFFSIFVFLRFILRSSFFFPSFFLQFVQCFEVRKCGIMEKSSNRIYQRPSTLCYVLSRPQPLNRCNNIHESK